MTYLDNRNHLCCSELALCNALLTSSVKCKKQSVMIKKCNQKGTHPSTFLRVEDSWLFLVPISLLVLAILPPVDLTPYGMQSCYYLPCTHNDCIIQYWSNAMLHLCTQVDCKKSLINGAGWILANKKNATPL